MKKRIFTTVLIFLLAFSCCALSACGNKVEGLFAPYTPTDIPPVLNYELDEGMILDGKADEDAWKKQNQSWATYTSKLDGVSVEYKITSVFGNNGVYFYGECNDSVINVRTDSAQYATYKTAMAFTVCAEETPDGKTINFSATEITVSTDGDFAVQRYIGNAWTFVDDYDSVGVGASVINGKLDENGNGTADGYSVEAFIPWNVIGLSSKPDQVRMKMAGIRYGTPTSKIRDYQTIDGVKTNAHKQWFVFKDSGAPVIPKSAVGYVIDGKDDDWINYTGKTHFVDIYSVDAQGNKLAVDTDQRYVEYKMRKHADGFLIYVEALQRIFLNPGSTAYLNTNVELCLIAKDNSKQTVFLTGSSAPASHVAVMTCTETNEVLSGTGEKLKMITAEWFIPNYILENILNVDASGETIRAAMVFRNGQFQLDTDEKNLDKNEVIVPQHAGANTKQPFLFYEQGYSPYTGDYLNKYYHIGLNGIIID